MFPEIFTVVVLESPKVAVAPLLFGTVAGLQFVFVFQSEVPPIQV
jgi:hypothetical protein